MSDASEPRPTTPFPAEGSAPAPEAAAADPLAGDWSEGLPGPVRALDVPQPALLSLEGLQLASPPSSEVEAAPPPMAEEVEAPDAWGAPGEDPLQSAPPPAAEMPSVIVAMPLPDATASAPAPVMPEVAAAPEPAVLPDVAPPAPAEVVQAEAAAPAGDAWATPPAESAPTPWSEAVAASPSSDSSAEATPAEDAPEPIAEVVAVGPAADEAVVPAADDPWSAPPAAAAPAQEWSPEAPSGEWEEARKPEPVLPAEAPAADWGTLSSGPDWSAPAAAAAEAVAPVEEAWSSAPPPPAESAWDSAPPLAEEVSWDGPPPPAAADAASTPSAAAAEEWSAPEAPPPPKAAAWNAPAAGASALEQLESEPEIAPVPGAAQELFGSVPVGSSLSGDGEEPHELGPPEELASPEEVLRPVGAVDDDDPDLLVPVDEEEPPPAPVPEPQPLAILQSPAAGALQVPGEHRVAVHTRGGRTRRGSVKDVDLGKSQFPLIPQGGGAPEPVYHAEVKAIFFMLAPGEKPRTGDGVKVKVTFADGRAIEGQRDGAEAKHGFFLVPSDAARTNTRRIYIARDATTDIKEG